VGEVLLSARPTGSGETRRSPSLELHFSPGACSRVCHIALEETGAPRLRRPVVFHDDEAAAERVRALATEALQPQFEAIDTVLAGREWYLGRWSIVDAYLYWIWFRATGYGFDPSPFPAYAAHAERVLARPATRRAIAREDEAERAAA